MCDELQYPNLSAFVVLEEYGGDVRNSEHKRKVLGLRVQSLERALNPSR